MIGVLFYLLICNAIFFSFIFWALTFAGKLLYSNKYYNYKYNFYECGFKNLSKNKISYQTNFILMALFLIIYDGEFLILLPYSLNAEFTTYDVWLCLIFFFFLIINRIIHRLWFSSIRMTTFMLGFTWNTYKISKISFKKKKKAFPLSTIYWYYYDTLNLTMQVADWTAPINRSYKLTKKFVYDWSSYRVYFVFLYVMRFANCLHSWNIYCCFFNLFITKQTPL